MKDKISKKYLVAFLILILALSALPISSFFTSANAAGTSTVPSNMLQYEWSAVVGNINTHFSTGPAPTSPELKWQKSVPSIGANPVAFDGMYLYTQRNEIVALDPETGNEIYRVKVPDIDGRRATAANIVKLDSTHMAVEASVGSIVNETHGIPAHWHFVCLKIADGSLVWESAIQAGPAAGYKGLYVDEVKLWYVGVGNSTGRGGSQNLGAIQAWDFSDLSKPCTEEWTYIGDGCPIEVGYLTYGDGKLFLCDAEPYQTCLNARTGEVLWVTYLTGAPAYTGVYYNGVIYKGCLDNTMVAMDGDTGNILWTNNPSPFGFWCSGMAAAYGMVYETNVDGYFYAFNAATGEIVWKYLGPGQYYPGYPAIADGKVYVATGQGVPSPLTGQGQCEFTCFDAYTGKVLWQLPKEFMAGASDYIAIAYGNLYLTDYITDPPGRSYRNTDVRTVNTVLYCYGSREGVEDWSMYGGDAAHTATSNGGPMNMAQEWMFHTEGPVISSPAVVAGKVYIGSYDQNWYCLDAKTGNKIWSFPTDFRIRSSPAVVNGKMYTGADDGFVYCLDANSGAQLWKTAAPGKVLSVMTGTYPEWRSSPTVAGGKVYVGSLDCNLYCLNADTGNIEWKVTTPGAVLTTPTYIAGDGLYFASQDGYIYKVNPNSGSIIWKISTPIGLEMAMQGTPCVADGKVVIGSGAGEGNSPYKTGQMYCLNAATGDFLWVYDQQAYNTTVPNLQMIWSALFIDHEVLGPVFVFGDFYHMSCVNASNGERIWTSYLTREHFGLPALSDNTIYVPADTFGIYSIDSTTGAKIDYFDAGAQVRSSPAIYDNKVYFGCINWNVYCVGQSSAATTYYGSTPPASSPVPTASASPTTVPSPDAGISSEVLVAIGAVVVIAIVALAVFFLRKRK